MDKIHTTKEAAKLLGIKPGRLITAIWNDQIPAPQKHGFNYVWTLEDLQKASQVILKREYKPEQG